MNTLISYLLISYLLPTLLGLLVKNTILLFAAGAACLTLRRSSAAMRHLVLCVALVGVLLMPIMSLSLPHWNVTLGRAAASLPSFQPAPTVATQPVLQEAAPRVHAVGSQAPPPLMGALRGAALDSATDTPLMTAPRPQKSYSFSLAIVLPIVGLCVWLIGLLLVLSHLTVGLHRIRHIGHQAVLLDDGSLQVAEAIRHQIGLRRSVRFLRASKESVVTVPVTWGILRPVVLLPAQSNTWSDDCLRAALLHELAHVQRGDWPTQLMARLACALYWWYPLVWWAARQAREESERACDDLVLGTGMKAADYAQRLVEVVRSLPDGTRTRTMAIAMAQPSEIEGRLQAVLAKGQNRSRLSRRALVVTLALVTILVLPLAVLRPVAHGATGSSSFNQSAEPSKRRMLRGILEFVYLKNVATDASPGHRLRLVVDRGTGGHSFYKLVDTKTGQTSRDPKAVQVALQAILAQGYQQRVGATSYLIPLELAFEVPTRDVFFTSDQRRQVDGLEREKKAFFGLLAASPVIATDADVDSAVARLTRTLPPTPSVDMTFTPDGARRIRAFTASHKGELMGVLADGGLITAPMIQGEFGGEGIILGGFRDINEAQTLATRLNAPAGTEVIGGGIRRATYPDGTIYEADEDAGQQVLVAPGYSTTLPNGCTIDVVGVMQAARKGENWVFGGPAWAADGKRASDLRLSDSGWSWPLYVTAGLTPCWIDLNISPPQGHLATEPLSTYLQLSGIGSKPWYRTFQRWGDRVGPFASEDGAPCSLRVGVAAGPWQTAATLPVHLNQRDLGMPASTSSFPLQIKLDDRPALMYQDGEGHRHTDYFLPAGQCLGNVARRIVAVEISGQTVAGSDWNSRPVALSDGRRSDTYPVATGLFGIPFYGPLVSDAAAVKEYRLETRPYQVVEFRNIQVKPRIVNGTASVPAVDSTRHEERESLTNMRRIGLLILEYIQDNNGRLPSLGTASLLERDLAPYQRQQEKFPDPQTGHRYAVRGGFLFVSPITGRSYYPAAGLSKNPISRITRPAYTVLLSDGPRVVPEAATKSRRLLELFADGHVSGRAIP